jgi:hypothetical protein
VGDLEAARVAHRALGELLGSAEPKRLEAAVPFRVTEEHALTDSDASEPAKGVVVRAPAGAKGVIP